MGGGYAIKSPDPTVKWCFNGLDPDKPVTIGPDGLAEVLYVATGFMCVNRSVFQKMIFRNGQNLEYFTDDPPHERRWAFFSQMVDRSGSRPRFLTEDWHFCQQWRDAGGRIFMDSEIALQHAGRAVFPLPLQANNPFAK